MSLHYPRPERTIEETYERACLSARRTSARRHYIFKSALRWMKREHPEEFQKLMARAHKKFPNPSGRKGSLRIAA